jgi:hypothetical protein
MTITRRKLALVIPSAVGSAVAAAQTPVAPPDPLEAAKARIKANTEALAKEAVPMGLEPAFQFKA